MEETSPSVVTPHTSPTLTFTRNTEDVPFESSSNLDPALLDPEMSSYFFGSQNHDEPPPYSSQLTYPADFTTHEPPSNPRDHPQSFQHPHLPEEWLPYNPFETYIAQPLSSSAEQGIDPNIFTQTVPHPLTVYTNTPAFVDELQTPSISISPAMLDKTAPVQEGVVWYSGAGKQIGGKRPPRHDGEGQGKGKGEGKGQGKGKGDLTARRKAVLGKRYEMNVDTGLDTVKRIKLVFHESKPVEKGVETGETVMGETPVLVTGSAVSSTSSAVSKTFPAAPIPVATVSSTKSTPTTPARAARNPQTPKAKRITRLVPQVTPPAAILPGRPVPMAKDLHLDDNSPSPSFSGTSPEALVGVVVPRKRIDKDLYPQFLACDAQQTMYRNRITGKIRGVMFSWS
jgi:hypothetical protein